MSQRLESSAALQRSTLQDKGAADSWAERLRKTQTQPGKDREGTGVTGSTWQERSHLQRKQLYAASRPSIRTDLVTMFSGHRQISAFVCEAFHTSELHLPTASLFFKKILINHIFFHVQIFENTGFLRVAQHLPAIQLFQHPK